MRAWIGRAFHLYLYAVGAALMGSVAVLLVGSVAEVASDLVRGSADVEWSLPLFVFAGTAVFGSAAAVYVSAYVFPVFLIAMPVLDRLPLRSSATGALAGAVFLPATYFSHRSIGLVEGVPTLNIMASDRLISEFGLLLAALGAFGGIGVQWARRERGEL